MELIFVMSFAYSLWRGADAGVSLYRKKNVTLQSVCKLIMAKDNNIDTIDMGFQKIEIDLTRFDKEPDSENLPILPTRNLVLFPNLTVSFELGRDSALALARYAEKECMPVGIVCQVNSEEETPAVTTGLFKYGTYADVLSVFERPDGAHSALVRARGKFRIMGRGSNPGAWLTARVKPVADNNDKSEELALVCEQIKSVALEAFTINDPTNLTPAVRQIDDNATLVNFLCTNLPFDPKAKNELLAKSKILDRAMGLLMEVNTFADHMKMTENIMKRARRNMEENQKNAFLQQQMEAIRETLYGDEADEADELLSKAEASHMPEKVLALFRREIEKLRRYNPTTPDYSVLYSYLETLVALPWGIYTASAPSLAEAEEVLENDHYGLEKVKERIVEQLALLMHNPDGKSPIICLVGPPGVGKTSIGKSVARALGRKYERVSFGGLHDEAEIRGHRRTYIGAMPGRIIDAVKRAGCSDPVLVLDEIDKIGHDYKGDPGAALLEVLDPEQNCHFHDNYVDVDFDLSKVLFIATANTLSTVSRPLLDRMEIIDISGYLLEEKVEIARRHLLPRIRRTMALTEAELQISDAAIAEIVRRYTAESGVRLLEKKLSSVARKAVLAKMKGEEFPAVVEPEHLYNLLGLAPFQPENYEGNDIPGVVTGLAWTEVGGAILMAEASLSKAKEGGRLTLTGHLGDVMKESAGIAFQWVKAHADKLGIDMADIDSQALHVHFPEGAVPKDGPSAGITIATAIVSAFTGRHVAPRLAMTGEITLRGRVLPVGGIREKMLAAKRAGITDIILSKDNRRDIDDMPERYTDGLTFHYADTVDDVLEKALL